MRNVSRKTRIAASCLLLMATSCSGPSEITEAQVASVRDAITFMTDMNPEGLPVSNNAIRIMSAEAVGKTLVVHGLIDLPETDDPERRAQHHDPSFHDYVYGWINDALCDLGQVRRIAQDSEGVVRLVVFDPARTPWGEPRSVFCPSGDYEQEAEASLRDVLPMLVQFPRTAAEQTRASPGRTKSREDRAADAAMQAVDQAAAAAAAIDAIPSPPPPSPPSNQVRPAATRPAVARPAAQPSGSLTFCVESNSPYMYNIAFAFNDPNTGEARSQGWWMVNHGQCRTLHRGPMSDSFHFRAYYGMQTRPSGSDFADVLTAMMAAGSIGILEGQHIYCVSEEAFQAVGNRRCVSRGYQNGGFVHVDAPGTRDIVVELYERGSYRVTW